MVARTRQTRDVLTGTAKTFHLNAQMSERVNSEHPPAGIERNHVREHTAKSKGLRRFAHSIDTRVVPRSAMAHVFEYSVKLFVSSVEARTHGRRGAIRRRGIVD